MRIEKSLYLLKWYRWVDYVCVCVRLCFCKMLKRFDLLSMSLGGGSVGFRFAFGLCRGKALDGQSDSCLLARARLS
jgi:hypothetical protein